MHTLILWTVACLLSLQSILQVETQAVEKIQWVSPDAVNFSLLEPAGRENPALGDIYVARGLHMGAMIPGKYIGRSENVVIAFNKTEIIATTYELLIHPKASVSWVPYTYSSSSTPPPETLVYGGIDPVTLETLFPCRAWHNETFLITGFYKLTKRRCEYPMAGVVTEATIFEFLSVNYFATLIGAGRGNPSGCVEQLV